MNDKEYHALIEILKASKDYFLTYDAVAKAEELIDLLQLELGYLEGPEG